MSGKGNMRELVGTSPWSLANVGKVQTTYAKYMAREG
jgi:hypothetical protein